MNGIGTSSSSTSIARAARSCEIHSDLGTLKNSGWVKA